MFEPIVAPSRKGIVADPYSRRVEDGGPMRANDFLGAIPWCAALAVGCSVATPPAPAENSGTAELDLTLSGGAVIDTVHYVVQSAAGATLAQGNIDVSGSPTLQTIVTLPPGVGDVVTFTASSTDGGVSCTGTSSPFSVLTNHPTHVVVNLQCRTVGAGGTLVTLSGSFSDCATIQSIGVDPSEAVVGAPMTLAATASGPDPSALTYLWSAPSGSFGASTASTTSFTCTSPGAVLVNLTVGDGTSVDGGPCGGTQSFTVQCDPAPAGCGDTSTDPNNCGSCGHSCLGGACVAGVCQPVVLASGVCPTSIAVDDTSVYFTHDVLGSWAVESVPKAGGTVTVLATQTSLADIYGDSVAVLDGIVYFITLRAGGDNVLESVPAGGGPVTVVAGFNVGGSIRQPTRAVVTAASGVYWANEEGGILHVDLSGNQTFVVDPDVLVHLDQNPSDVSLPYPVTLAVDSNNVYFTPNSTIALDYLCSAPLAGGPVTTIANVPDPLVHGELPLSAASMVSDGVNVYWATLQAPGAMFQVPVAPVGARSLFTQAINPGATVTSLALDTTRLYWTEHAALGTVGAAALGTGVATPLAVGQSYPFAIASDATSVYWVNAGVDMTQILGSPTSCTGSIMKVAK
jgi:hypothetical protein